MNKKYTETMVIDKKFHALMYIPDTMRIMGHDTVCQWKCDCGNEITAKARDVIRGRVQSCKCYSFRKKENNAWWTGIGDMPGSYWNAIQCNARNRKIKLNVTKQEIWDLFLKQNRKCALTGVELYFRSPNNRYDGTASLDRIDSNKDYVIGNVQWVHKHINNMKKGLEESEFMEWCKRVTNYCINA